MKLLNKILDLIISFEKTTLTVTSPNWSLKTVHVRDVDIKTQQIIKLFENELRTGKCKEFDNTSFITGKVISTESSVVISHSLLTIKQIKSIQKIYLKAGWDDAKCLDNSAFLFLYLTNKV